MNTTASTKRSRGYVLDSAELFRLPGQLALHAGGQLGAGDAVEVVERFPEAHARNEVRGDRRRALPVVVVELLRRHRLLSPWTTFASCTSPLLPRR